MKVTVETERPARPIWLPPAVSVASLFTLFAAAMAVRRSPFAEAGRPVMTALSTAAAAMIALYGFIMIVQARARGLASAASGLVMLVLGLYTANHVLR